MNQSYNNSDLASNSRRNFLKFITYFTSANFLQTLISFKAKAGGFVAFAFFKKPKVVKDPYFSYTSLLLTGEGVNAGQNNTFIDSSSNNAAITVTGTVNQGSFGPFGNSWSHYFDGSVYTNYLGGVNNPTLFDFGTGDFTVEAWINITGDSAIDPAGNRSALIVGYAAPGTDNYWLFMVGGNSTTTGINLGIGFAPSNGLNYGCSVNTTFNKNTWYHVAAARVSGTTYFYVNGSTIGNAVISNLNQNIICGNTAILHVGCRRWDNNNYKFPFSGYLSNVRVIKGTAIYTSNFSVPTSPLAAITGTSLLTCQSSQFIDNSGNNVVLTVNGSPSVQKFSPFAEAYNPAVHGGSMYCDGSTSYISMPNSTALTLSGGVYTIEGWVYPTGNYSNYNTLIGKRSGPSTSAWEVYLNISNGLLSYYDGTTRNSTTTPPAKAWSHFAAVYDGTNINLYLNGSRVMSTAVANTDYASTIFVGSYAPYSENTVGYISNVRIVKGTALYSGATYTVPKTILTAISGTSLLLNFTNASIYDSTGINNLLTVGNAQTLTANKKYGNSSMALDGSGDYMVMPTHPNFQLTGDFTIECWLYPISRIVSYPCVFNNYSAWAANTGIALCLGHASWDVTKFHLCYNAGLAIQSTTSIAYNNWQHFALERVGSTVTMYINGVSNGTCTISGTINGTNDYWWIGIGGDNVANTYYNGSIDDFRVTKGVARYKANFTPPTQGLPVS